jgi:hypothetical protein
MGQTLLDWGIPEELYTDRRAVFGSVRTRSSDLGRDTSTQFRIAAAKLGIARIHLTSVPQAKGRIERLFNTFQDRLVAEMRSAGVDNLQDANIFLPSFISDHNARYALDRSNLPCAFGPTLSQDEINMVLSVVSERSVSRGSTISYKGATYALFSPERRIELMGGTKVIVLKSLDDRLYALHGDNIWVLLRLDGYAFPTPDDVKEKMYIPPKDHPWKEAGYQMLIRKYRKAS